MPATALFWGIVVSAGENHLARIPDGLFINLNNIALKADGKSKSPAVAFCVVDTTKYILGTLTPGGCEQFKVDLAFSFLNRGVEFGVEGPGEIHFTGFMTDEPSFDDDSDNEMDGLDEMEMDEEEDASE